MGATHVAHTERTVREDALLDSRSIAVALLGADGLVIECNERFRTEFVTAATNARSVSLGLDSLLADGETWPSVVERCAASRVAQIELARSSCTETVAAEVFPPVDRSGAYTLIVATEQSQPGGAQTLMARNARLEALVCLTSGVAHDFNNLLTILVGNLALAAEEVRDDAKTFGRLKTARDAARRGGQLIRQLMTFARQKEVGQERISPVRIVENLVPLIDRALGGAVELSLKLDAEAGRIDASAAQFESAIVNLCVNARDAIVRDGRVEIAVDNANGSVLGVADDSAVRIRVTDDGRGIPEGLLDQVKRPFFTTKSDSGGTGLGLSMVELFVGQYGGVLEIDSVATEGTSITITFPRSGDEVDETASGTMPLPVLPRGDETIVAVAREQSLLDTIEQILGVLGYSVLTSIDEATARQQVRERAPDLIIVDGRTIDGLLETAVAAGNGCRCLQLVSPSVAEETDSDGGSGVVTPTRTLTKPFSLPDLAITVRDVLDEESP